MEAGPPNLGEVNAVRSDLAAIYFTRWRLLLLIGNVYIQTP
jgi:hypothetical protein